MACKADLHAGGNDLDVVHAGRLSAVLVVVVCENPLYSPSHAIVALGKCGKTDQGHGNGKK